ncbi:hypothetical protein SAMN05660649_01846 [Desulfotomaculum arcticum]|uniref:Uncharacterized protein n=1 Tax=Desulfotruncus arcticus DSM 17038 TaxID=1121424 RepID=A0A1I2SAS3_9FIRM|nr:hypothetical protein SAMN05660649_01846 [Desulfotomaculum arcticum] [Desulfotruncus arcticus DSM 17038]
MELNQAVDLCRSAGMNVNIAYTTPPRGEPGGHYRVVRCKMTAEKVFLIAAREIAMKGGVVSSGL